MLDLAHVGRLRVAIEERPRRLAGIVTGLVEGLSHETIVGAVLRAQTHSHTKKAGGFDCADRGAAVHFWYGFFDYSDWRAIEWLALLQPADGAVADVV